MKKVSAYETAQGSCRRLGVFMEGDALNFAVDCRGYEEVTLILYKKGKDEILAQIPLPREGSLGSIRAVRVKGIKPGQIEYNYRMGGKVVTDPYATRVTGRENFGARPEKEDEHRVRSAFAALDYDWEGDKCPEIPFEDGILYSLHVRGFTMQGGGRTRHKGTFAGLKDKADYLTELGVNQILLMPAYEFDEIMPVEESMQKYASQEEPVRLNYWGYVAGNYFAPKAGYSAFADPTVEFKDMVKAFHARGIEVLMEFFFPVGTSPRLVINCLVYWMSEYHIDGFHLLGDGFVSNAAARDPAFSKSKLLSNYFPTEEIYGKHALPVRKCLGEYNDGFLIDARKLLKGDADQLQSFVWRMRRNPAGCAVINYITHHDGFTLADLVSYDERHNEENGERGYDGNPDNYSWNCGCEGPSRKKKIQELRLRQMRNAFAMVLLSAGTPMLLGGDEFGNSQSGNNNPYCLDSPVSWVDWSGLRRNNNLHDFVQKLTAFRRKHKILHQPEELKNMDYLSCGYPDISYHGNRAWYGAFENGNRQIGIMYCGQYAGEEDFLYAAYNLHWDSQTFALPKLPEGMSWYKGVDTETEEVWLEGEPPAEVERTFTVPGRTIVVLIGRK